MGSPVPTGLVPNESTTLDIAASKYRSYRFYGSTDIGLWHLLYEYLGKSSIYRLHPWNKVILQNQNTKYFAWARHKNKNKNGNFKELYFANSFLINFCHKYLWLNQFIKKRLLFRKSHYFSFMMTLDSFSRLTFQRI